MGLFHLGFALAPATHSGCLPGNGRLGFRVEQSSSRWPGQRGPGAGGSDERRAQELGQVLRPCDGRLALAGHPGVPGMGGQQQRVHVPRLRQRAL